MADEHSQQLLRNAIEDALSRPGSADFELAALRAGIVQDDPDLVAVFEELTAPIDREATFHIDGPTVEGHTTGAQAFARFIGKLSDATKEVAKTLAKKDRLEDCLLIDAIAPGSVAVTLRAKSASTDTTNHPAHENVPSVASDALDTVSDLLTLSARDDIEDAELDAVVGGLSEKARNEVRQLARHVRKEAWTVTGVTRKRGTAPKRISFDTRGAGALVSAVDRALPSKTDRRVTGLIDGLRQSDSRVYLSVFADDPKRPHSHVALKVKDAILLTEAARLYAADSTMPVMAKIVVEQQPPKEDEEVPKKVEYLADLEPAGEQGSIDLGVDSD